MASCLQEEEGKINLDYVEKRQDDLFTELQQLSNKVSVLSEKLGVDPESILQQVVTKILRYCHYFHHIAASLNR